MSRLSSLLTIAMLLITSFTLFNSSAVSSEAAPIPTISGFAGGSGTESDPYQISNITQLQNMSSDLDAHYVLVNDIDASATSTWNWNGGNYEGFDPIGDPSLPFKGSLNGQGYKIMGLFIDRFLNNVGLFGYTNNGCNLMNINLLNCNITGDYYCGGLVGNTNGGTKIDECHITGTINGNVYVGGFVGYNGDSSINNCSSSGNVSGYSNLGGFSGYNYGNAMISRCKSDSNTSGTVNVGGFIGRNDATIRYCFSKGDANGNNWVGGFVGNMVSTVSDCYSSGNASGNDRIGGFTGAIVGTASNCYSTGKVYGITTNIGGFAGSGSGTVIQCFWDNITSGLTTSFGGIGKNTTEMMKKNTFTDVGWDFGSIWSIEEGGKYPFFGIFSVNYKIMNLSDLHNIRYDMNGDFILGADINASATRTWNNGAGFLPIGDSPTRFGGTLDGNNHTISGLFINRPSTNGVGLFGFTTAGCNIHYVSLNDVNITGYSYVGALAGAHDVSTIVRDSNSSGKVKGNNEVGGLFGRSYGLVERCFSSVEVEASNQAGGLVGVNLDGTVNNCFASGNVTGFSYLGGLVGRNRRISSPPTVTDSYATGYVSPGSSGGLVGLNDAGSSVTGCFYDNITTGHSSGSPGTPKNTTDMMKGVTFSSAGWDLENVWNIKDGSSYPFFGRFDVSYTIYDLWDLHCMRYNKTGDYVLANNINATETKTWFNSAGFDPIGDNNEPFTGTLDGRGYVIAGLYINRSSINYVGLLGNIASNCFLSNVSLVNINISADSYVGGLVGYGINVVVKNCSTEGDVSGKSNVGGFAGTIQAATIENSSSSCNVNGRYYIGGFIGYNNGALIENCFSAGNTYGTDEYLGGLLGVNYNHGMVNNCYATGEVSGNQEMGGLVGYNYLGSNIKNSYAIVNVTGTGDYSGGLAGVNHGTMIENCYAAGNLNGNDFIGGLVGYNINTATIQNCSANVTVSGNNIAGGLLGYNYDSLVENCYANGNVIRKASSTNINFGGFAGMNEQAKIKNSYSTGPVTYAGATDPTDKGFCGAVDTNNDYEMSGNFWDNLTSGQTTTAGGATGRNTTDMMNKHLFILAKWDFNEIWVIKHTSTYPYFGRDHMNNNPVSNNDMYNVSEDDILYILAPGVLENDDDSEDLMYPPSYRGTLAISKYDTTSSQGAVVELNPDGSFKYDPTGVSSLQCLAIGEFYVDTFTYTLSDGTANDTATVYINVTGANDQPEIITPQTVFADEDSPFALKIEVIDLDVNDSLLFNLVSGPAWLSLNITTGNLNGTPLNGDVGTHVVNISVSDGNGGSDWIRFTITVENTNDNPMITTMPILSTNEDSLYSTYFNAADIDPVSTSFTWSLITDASWLSLTGNHLHGTPKNSDVGSYWVNISVNDGYGGSDWENFTLTVINTNDAPIFTFTPVTSILEDQFYALKTTAFDPDPTSDTLGWYLENGPGWLSLDANNGWLNGTPLNNDVGSYHINVSVRDGNGGHDFMEFLLEVINVNDDPMIMSSTPPESVMEDSVYSMDFSGIDIDPVPTIFEWSMETNASWLTLDGTHLHGIPTNDDVGLYLVNITLKDGDGGSDWREFTVEVINTNDDPYFTVDPLGFVSEDHEYNITMDAEDPDPTNDILTWSLEEAPGFLSIDQKTGILRGTPTNEYVGAWDIIAIVSDENGGQGTIEFKIRVDNTNDAPIIVTEPNTDIEEDEEYFLGLVATDEDPGENVFEWEMRTNATWLSLYGDTLKGTPSDDDDVGSFYVNITIDDGNGGYDQLYFIINVANTNDPPVIISDSNINAVEDELYTMQPNVRDPDIGDSFQWSMTGPNWLNIDPDTGLVNGTPKNADVGQHWIKITVTDLEGESDSISFMLKVQNTNDAPEWLRQPWDTNTTEEDLLTWNVQAVDPDGDPLTYSISTTPELDITMNPDTGMILCNMPPPGFYLITATASDGIETIETVFQINVSKVPEVMIPTDETDTDSDGMPDWWEDLYGLDPQDSSDAGEDLDDDSITNLEEFNGKTSPTEDNSELEKKETSPVFFIIIAILAILALVFLVLFVTKGGKGASNNEISSPEISNDVDETEPGPEETETSESGSAEDAGARPPEIEEYPEEDQGP